MLSDKRDTHFLTVGYVLFLYVCIERNVFIIKELSYLFRRVRGELAVGDCKLKRERQTSDTFFLRSVAPSGDP